MKAIYVSKKVGAKEWDSWYSNFGSYIHLGSSGYGASRETRMGFITCHLSDRVQVATPDEEYRIKKGFINIQYQFPGITEFMKKEDDKLKNREVEEIKSYAPTELF